MEDKRLIQITNNFLLSANELAFIEEAEGTRDLLLNFYDLFRYIISRDEEISLYSELEALKKYIIIQKARYNNRFTVHIDNEEANKDIFIKRSLLIDYFDQILYRIIEDLENTVHFTFEFEIGETILIKLVQNVGNKLETYSINL
jgi:Fe2+ or Zn2+ uptake regulation protein